MLWKVLKLNCVGQPADQLYPGGHGQPLHPWRHHRHVRTQDLYPGEPKLDLAHYAAFFSFQELRCLKK